MGGRFRARRRSTLIESEIFPACARWLLCHVTHDYFLQTYCELFPLRRAR
jgi:hypothetical protein